MKRRPKKTGRKDYSFRLRMDKDTLDQLNMVSETMDISKSDAVRIGIKLTMDAVNESMKNLKEKKEKEE